MKMLCLLFLLFLLSCQETTKTPDRPIERVSPVEEDDQNVREAFALSAIGGSFEVSGENLSRKGNLSYAENLKVIEVSSQKVVDEYQLFDWGPVGFSTDSSILKVYPKESVLEISYQLDDKKKILRSSKCEFKARPEATRLKALLESAKGPNPDWEGIFSGISQLAYEGDKASYDFFMNPDATAKEYLKNSDGAASIEPIVKVLKFMKSNGCNW